MSEQKGRAMIDDVAEKTTHGLDHLEPRRKHRWPDLKADTRRAFSRAGVRRELETIGGGS